MMRVTPSTTGVGSPPAPSELKLPHSAPPDSRADTTSKLHDRRDALATLLGTWYGKSGLVLFSIGLACFMGSQLPRSTKSREPFVAPREALPRTSTTTSPAPHSSPSTSPIPTKETAPVQNERPLTESEIRELQSRLQALGFNPGDIDGMPGPQTADAVKRFETARMMLVLGKIDRQTLNKLREARPAP